MKMDVVSVLVVFSSVLVFFIYRVCQFSVDPDMFVAIGNLQILSRKALYVRKLFLKHQLCYCVQHKNV